jgi:hypothetical protein
LIRSRRYPTLAAASRQRKAPPKWRISVNCYHFRHKISVGFSASRQWWGTAIPINRFLAKNMLEPDQVERLNKAYTFALRSLDLVDRDDPIMNIVAKKIIEVAATTGSRDPKEISKTALRQLGSHRH